MCYNAYKINIDTCQKIGDGATINVASVVIYDVKPNSVMMGNPARRLIIPNIKGDGKA